MLDPTHKYRAQAGYARASLSEMLDYIAERTGRRVAPPVSIVISGLREGDACAVRGLALSSAKQVYLYVSEDTPRSEIRTALAHELGHVLQAQASGGDPSSATLAEGFATWVSGRYWPEWKPSDGFEDAVRRYLERGAYIPLTEEHLPCDQTTRDRIYTERAAFIQWLLSRYGEEQFWKLNSISTRPEDRVRNPDELPFLRPPVIRNNPSYEHARWERVYGNSLPALEDEWLSTLST